jgi:hypothetical protein
MIKYILGLVGAGFILGGLLVVFIFMIKDIFKQIKTR